MSARAPGLATPAAASLRSSSAASHSVPAACAQALPPREHHDPVADDKLALFALPQVHRLVGTWQGPGTIAELSRRARA
jgi:hypothetical protein